MSACTCRPPPTPLAAWSPGSGNVIAGNHSHQVEISGSGATGDLVVGNYIGLNSAGTQARTDPTAPSWADGIVLDVFANNDTIGGTTAAARNVVAVVPNNGIELSNFANSPPSNILVQGNYVGTDKTGMVALGNGTNGILVYGSNNTIGGLTATPGTGAGNVISGNDQRGIWLLGGFDDLVEGNIVGLAANGSTPIGNASDGVGVNALKQHDRWDGRRRPAT